MVIDPDFPITFKLSIQDLSQTNIKGTTGKSSKGKAASTQTKDSTKKPKDNKAPSAAELAHIYLDGEEDEEVEIYDTCDDVRKKIRDHLKQPGVTQASLSREFSELLPNSKVQPRHVAKFLEFKGPRAGAHSPAFYGGYVYFEKLRIYQNKKKSKKREELEDAWEHQGGFPREGSHNMRLLLPNGTKWRLDKLGCIEMNGRPSPFVGGIASKKASK